MIIGFSFGFFLCSEVLKMFKISSYMNIPEMHNILYINKTSVPKIQIYSHAYCILILT